MAELTSPSRAQTALAIRNADKHLATPRNRRLSHRYSMRDAVDPSLRIHAATLL